MTADSAYKCSVFQKPFHVICGHEFKYSNGVLVEGFPAPKLCSVCHSAQRSPPPPYKPIQTKVLPAAVPSDVSTFANRQVSNAGGTFHYSYHYIPPIGATRPPHEYSFIALALPNYKRKEAKKKSRNAIKQLIYRDKNKLDVWGREHKRYLERIAKSKEMGGEMRARGNNQIVKPLPSENVILFNKAMKDATAQGGKEGVVIYDKINSQYNVYRWCHCWVPHAPGNRPNLSHITTDGGL